MKLVYHFTTAGDVNLFYIHGLSFNHLSQFILVLLLSVCFGDLLQNQCEDND